MKRKLKKEQIERIYKLTMPELFDTAVVEEVELLPSWEKYTYTFDKLLSLDQMMDIIDEQNDLLFLYHFIPSSSVNCGHSCCYVSVPQAGFMVKITVSTDESGLCDCLHLTIYFSSEVLIEDIIQTNNLMDKKFGFRFDDTYFTFLRLYI